MSNQVEPRLRAALREAAAQVQPSADAWQTIPHRRVRPSRPSFVVPGIVAAVIVAVIVALIAGVVVLRGGSGVQTPATEPQETTPERLLLLEADAAVWMLFDAPTPQVDAVREFLMQSPDVSEFAFLDKAATYEDFKQVFRDRPDIVANVDPAALPVSFRIRVHDCASRSRLIQRLQVLPGVDVALNQPGLSHAQAERFRDSREPLPPETRGRCGDQPPTGSAPSR